MEGTAQSAAPPAAVEHEEGLKEMVSALVQNTNNLVDAISVLVSTMQESVISSRDSGGGSL